MTAPTGLAAGREKFARTKRGGRAAPPPSPYATPAERDKQSAEYITRLVDDRDPSKPGVVTIDGQSAGVRGMISRDGASIRITEPDRDDPIVTVVPISRVTAVS